MRIRSRISELCQCMGITLSKLQILIFIIHIGNLLTNSLYGAIETFASFVLEVTFHVNGLDLTYANIWQASFTNVYIYKTMVAPIFQREVCMKNREPDWIAINSFWPGDYAQFMKCH